MSITNYFSNKIVKMASVLGALILIVSTTWTVADYTRVRPVTIRELTKVVELQEQLSDTMLQLQFQQLKLKRELGDLDFLEQQQYCSIARQLQYVGVPGCVFGTTPSFMEPGNNRQ